VGCQLWVLLRVECSGKSVYLYSLRLMSVVGYRLWVALFTNFWGQLYVIDHLASDIGHPTSSTRHRSSNINHLALIMDCQLWVVSCGLWVLLRVECSGKSVYLYSLRLMSVVGYRLWVAMFTIFWGQLYVINHLASDIGHRSPSIDYGLSVVGCGSRCLQSSESSCMSSVI
jgi:hypothetical protein